MGMGEVGLLSAVPYLVGVIAEMSIAAWSDASGPAHGPGMAVLFAGGGGLYASLTFLGPSHFWIGFALLTTIAGASMYAPYGPYFAYLAEILLHQRRGRRHRPGCNSMGALEARSSGPMA